MNRFEYMRRLENLLSDISPSEKEAALTYYNDYFNDAGEENEQQVMEELGSPEQVAAGVKEGLGLQTGEERQREGTENLYTGTSAKATSDTGSSDMENKNMKNLQAPAQRQQKKQMAGWQITLIVIGLIFASPLLLALLSVVLALIISVFSLIFGLLIGFGAAAVALYISALACALLGLVLLPVSALTSGALIGAGCLCAAVGILCMILTVLVAMTVPAACKGTAWMWRKMFHFHKA